MLGACKVCGDVASGKYFGALVCVPCKVGTFVVVVLRCLMLGGCFEVVGAAGGLMVFCCFGVGCFGG